MRVAVGVEYKGTDFSGWQSQRGVRTVQDCVEHAFSAVADHPVRVVTAGRTDSGVHATGQVIHFDTESLRSAHSWLRGANSHLPRDVRILWVKPVPDSFHARFSALERSYRYVMHVSTSRPAVFADLCTWVYYALDTGFMADAAQSLLGRHDFSSFRAAGCQSDTAHRTITRLDLGASGPWIWLDVSADAFLQHMVRNIVGTLMLVGRRERDPGWVEQVLGSRDRTQAGATAPPEGLYLSEVSYPPELDLPGPASRARFW